jgi:Family of unknown function (DUF6159)
MAGRFARSWRLFKASVRVLRDNKRLLLFPALSSVAAVAVMASLALAVDWSPDAETYVHSTNEDTLARFAVVFLSYFVLFNVVVFFNTALVAAAANCLDGGAASLAHGFQAARERLGRIVGYASIAATVGVLLRTIEERLPLAGQIAVNLVGAAWTVATFLVVPVLVHRDVGPITAVKESARLLKDTWGENLIAAAGMGAFFSLLYLPLVLIVAGSGFSLLFGMATMGTEFEKTVILLTMMAVALLALVLLSLAHAALQGIYGAALYRYATGSMDASADRYFPSDLLDSAFAPKK